MKSTRLTKLFETLLKDRFGLRSPQTASSLALISLMETDVTYLVPDKILKRLLLAQHYALHRSSHS